MLLFAGIDAGVDADAGVDTGAAVDVSAGFDDAGVKGHWHRCGCWCRH